MLFKISNGKDDQSRALPDDSITFARTPIPNLEIQIDNQKTRKGLVKVKWLPCITSVIIMLVLMSALISVLIFMNAFKINSRKLSSGQMCHNRQQTGTCLSKGYCCGDQYVIGKDVCSGTGLCCLGAVTKCKGEHNLIECNLLIITIKYKY